MQKFLTKGVPKEKKFFQNKKEWVTNVIKKFGVVFFVLGVLVIVMQSFNVVQLRYKMNQLNESVAFYKNENKILSESLEEQKNKIHIEEVARQDLGMVKSGEVPIKVIEESPAKKEKTENHSVQSGEKIGIYMKDWYSKLENWIDGWKK